MTEDDLELIARTLNDFEALIDKLPTPALRSQAIAVVLVGGITLLRDIEGDAFTHGWLQTALQDLEGKLTARPGVTRH
ncbi:hypothetical protein EV699_11256 [Plasticicumulans lactativorans]|uniref:Uncharacterized protein n=1 Tax=Plasticicumulans lactativorans TaxID=1133106 RepID=A0A4R2L110_9GAMM|nr:hypothetical protein [Plasticicumulans lactativorans]TCO80721.1 hypothetical protein EV699_11256 [Plasticicumulans lactativorans]